MLPRDALLCAQSCPACPLLRQQWVLNPLALASQPGAAAPAQLSEEHVTSVATAQRGSHCSSFMGLLLHTLGSLFPSLSREAAGEQLLHLYSAHEPICEASVPSVVAGQSCNHTCFCPCWVRGPASDFLKSVFPLRPHDRLSNPYTAARAFTCIMQTCHGHTCKQSVPSQQVDPAAHLPGL